MINDNDDLIKKGSTDLKRELIVTNDGSSSLFVKELNETYHSIHGAKQEAEHVFIKMGIERVRPSFDILNILEIGLGTGLNAALSFDYSFKTNSVINYTAIEKYPIIQSELIQLNYFDFLNPKVLSWIHEIGWEEFYQYSNSTFRLLKLQSDLKTVKFKDSYNLIFFDAFAPNKQPSMWTIEVFKKLFNVMESGGLLTTYCCQGAVKRTLIEAGFKVEKVKGPPGKREMLNAWRYD